MATDNFSAVLRIENRNLNFFSPPYWGKSVRDISSFSLYTVLRNSELETCRRYNCSSTIWWIMLSDRQRTQITEEGCQQHGILRSLWIQHQHKDNSSQTSKFWLPQHQMLLINQKHSCNQCQTSLTVVQTSTPQEFSAVALFCG